MPRITVQSALLVGAALVVGFLIGTWRAGPIVEVGRADTSEEGGGSISTDPWTYEFAKDVAWVSDDGEWNFVSPPECLMPGGSVNVRFAATEVTIEGSTWRPVVWIDCRSASAP